MAPSPPLSPQRTPPPGANQAVALEGGVERRVALTSQSGDAERPGQRCPQCTYVHEACQAADEDRRRRRRFGLGGTSDSTVAFSGTTLCWTGLCGADRKDERDEGSVRNARRRLLGVHHPGATKSQTRGA